MAQIFGIQAENRAVLSVAGPDATGFLQGLVTNDVSSVPAGTARYAALLTPQGKYLFDMIIHPDSTRPDSTHPDGDAGFLLDVAADRIEALAKRLTLYRLRAKVTIAPRPDLAVWALWRADGAPLDAAAGGDAALCAAPDPRHGGLGLRLIAAADAPALVGVTLASAGDYAALCVALGAPSDGVDLAPEASFPLDLDFERLNGVDFKKGCYVGQEVTARMKHKAERRKKLYRVTVEAGTLRSGMAVTAAGKAVGALGAVAGGEALAVLRADRVGEGPLMVGDAPAAARPFDD